MGTAGQTISKLSELSYNPNVLPDYQAGRQQVTRRVLSIEGLYGARNVNQLSGAEHEDAASR
jgi:hypothetical protein